MPSSFPSHSLDAAESHRPPSHSSASRIDHGAESSLNDRLVFRSREQGYCPEDDLLGKG